MSFPCRLPYTFYTFADLVDLVSGYWWNVGWPAGIRLGDYNVHRRDQFVEWLQESPALVGRLVPRTQPTRQLEVVGADGREYRLTVTDLHLSLLADEAERTGEDIATIAAQIASRVGSSPCGIECESSDATGSPHSSSPSR